MEPKQNPVKKSKLIRSIVDMTIFLVAFMLLAGDWRWLEGWIFVAWFLALGVGVITYLHYKDPELLAERYKRPGSGNQKQWDRYYLMVLMLLFLSWVVVMPLDARRFHWTHWLSVSIKFAGGAGLIISYFFIFRAFADNTFLSPLVRIQEERKQHVVSTGVYGWVRHPMYLGAALMFICAPVMLGSGYGFVIGLATAASLGVRIVGEEAMLEHELHGYSDYKQKVRFRLIPWVW